MEKAKNVKSTQWRDIFIRKTTSNRCIYKMKNCLFAGTTVMAGEGKMVVTDVGINTINGDTWLKCRHWNHLRQH